jgi:3D (Asp-Asp-Asp) domain-containing protein
MNKTRRQFGLGVTLAIVLMVCSGADWPQGGKVRLFRVTAYCPCQLCCGPKAAGVTASGHVIQPGDRIVAAPPAIPFGSVMTIPGYGRAVVRDRGGAIRDDRLDVYFPTHSQAKQWGVKYLLVKLD